MKALPSALPYRAERERFILPRGALFLQRSGRPRRGHTAALAQRAAGRGARPPREKGGKPGAGPPRPVPARNPGPPIDKTRAA